MRTYKKDFSSKKFSRKIGFTEPKPFIFIDLPSKVNCANYKSHEKFSELTGSLTLQIEVISDYLFVGSGEYDFTENDALVYYTFFRTNDSIAIPGTSLKGAIRSVAEAISNSCVSQYGKKEIKQVPPPYRECKFDLEKNKINLCPSCKLFGTTGYGGRVELFDAYPSSAPNLEIVKIGELFGPRIVKSQRKFYENKRFNPVGNLTPEKNYRFVEAVVKGSLFLTTFRFRNLIEDELSLLLYSMGINQDYIIKIGGAKPRCFGTVKFNPLAIELLDAKGILTSNCFNKKALDWINQIMGKKILLNENFNKLKEGMILKEETCPKANY